MGFSSALQGRAAHEALIVRQDAELRLMEVMKRTLLSKAKCDKEYAIGLAAVAQQGHKIDRADEMQGNQFFIFHLINFLINKLLFILIKSFGSFSNFSFNKIA